MWLETNSPTPFSARKSAIAIDGGVIRVEPAAMRPLNLNQDRYSMAWLEVTRTDRDVIDLVAKYGTANSQAVDTVEAYDAMRSELRAIVGAMREFGALRLADDDAMRVLPPRAEDSHLHEHLNNAIVRHGLSPRFIPSGDELMVGWSYAGNLHTTLVVQAIMFAHYAGAPSIGICALPRCGTLFQRARSERMYCSSSCGTMAQREGLAKTKATV